jgi:hypothetical protein
MRELQLRLGRAGQYLPEVEVVDPENLAARANVTASSELALGKIAAGGDWLKLDASWAMLLPLAKGKCPVFHLEISSEAEGTVICELRRAAKAGNFTPDELIDRNEIPIAESQSSFKTEFSQPIDREGYHFVVLLSNPAVKIKLSDERITGVLALTNEFNKRVATTNRQEPPPEIGIDSFEFWLPQRRPQGRNLAMTIEPPLQSFGPQNVLEGPARPVQNVNAWVADPGDENPKISLTWPKPVRFKRVIVEFDPDWDHAMESVLMSHPEEVVPFMVRDFDLLDDNNRLIAEVRENHSAHFDCRLNETVETDRLSLRIHSTHGAPASVFRIRVLP